LGKKNEPAVHKSQPGFVIGQSITLRRGQDVCLVGTGNILPVVIETASLLEMRGVSTRVESMHTVKPLDTGMLKEVFQRFRLVVSVEEHLLSGGMGSSVAEWVADHGPQKARLLRVGIDDSFFEEAGDQQKAREAFGLTAPSIVERVLARLM
jgi:transketolase